MEAKAREVISNQEGVHSDLLKLLARHKNGVFQRPIAPHTQEAFERFLQWLNNWQGDVILDACCGVGESTRHIAKTHPHAKVIGVDKSIARLNKHHSYQAKDDGVTSSVESKDCEEVNYLLLQADLNDFWRLLANYKQTDLPVWTIVKQTIFYPNPYPKKSQVGKRWHASAVMPFIMQISSNIELRSNWNLYLQEFLIAAEFYGVHGTITEVTNAPITPFERKYLDANQTCFKLDIRPWGCDK